MNCTYCHLEIDTDEYVEGVELTEEYIPIAEARIKYWLSKIDEQEEQLRLV